MAWFKKDKGVETPAPPRSKGSEGMWLKCNHCREIVYRKEVDRNNKVCPKCEYHFPISVTERIGLMVDLGTFKEWDTELEAQDPLAFHDTKSYKDRVKAQQEKTGRKDALVTGESAFDDLPSTMARLATPSTSGDTICYGKPETDVPPSMDLFDRVANAAEKAGFEYMLVPVATTCWEAWVSAAMRSGAILTALLVAPAAGRTSGKALRETSQ